jgi:plasmid stabilization system protein ParE
MKITLHPSAEQDLREAAEFYEREGSPLVASRFVAEFRRLVSLVAQNPQMGSPRSNGRRALLMRVFPYSVIYRATVDEILILVVKHDGRRPGYGRRRS